MPDEDFKVNWKQILTRSKDEIARDERLFAQAKAALERFVPKTDAQHAYLMGISRQKAMRSTYRELRHKPDAALTEADVETFLILSNQLAECAALQANFFRAARLHQSSRQTGEYLAMGNAVKNRRFPHSCPKTRLEMRGISAKGEFVPNCQAISEVYLPKEKREVVIYKCFECKGLFAEYKN